MQPTPPMKYPQYIADQLLTADHLNDAFRYLDEGSRLTRANLIGIGIVCGLEVKVNAAANTITITAGCGITSEGYLIEVEEHTYGRYKVYDSLAPVTYSSFTHSTPAVRRFDIHELVNTSSGEDIFDIDATLITNKVVLLYAELYRKDAKNCDPESCDAKGANITVTFRPLVVSTAAAIDILRQGSNGPRGAMGNALDLLPAIPLRRFDVKATAIDRAEDIYNIYYPLISQLPARIIPALKDLHKIMAVLLNDAGTSPANILTSVYRLIAEKDVLNNPLTIQYWYDFFADIVAAYDELRETLENLIGQCCPPGNLFPRHLLLGATNGQTESYRTYFIPSPAVSGGSEQVAQLRSLYRRLSDMLRSFVFLDSDTDAKELMKLPTRITPSVLGPAPLSKKAVPFYFDVTRASYRLLRNWNYARNMRSRPGSIHGYHAADFPDAPEHVQEPLRYDLEPYNFLRVEGIVGKSYQQALEDVKKDIDQYRLPVDVIALRTGRGDGFEVWGEDFDCYFEDLELAFELEHREWEAIVGKSIAYLNEHYNLAAQYLDRGYDHSKLQILLNWLYQSKSYTQGPLRNYIGSYYQFIDLYTKIENEARRMRERLYPELEHSTAHSAKEYNSIFMEDLIDHLDELVLSCEKGGLRAVYDHYVAKSSRLYGKLFLYDFLKDHPGIQHKAGVPIGGTFIMVYTQPGRVIGNNDSFFTNNGDTNRNFAAGNIEDLNPQLSVNEKDDSNIVKAGKDNDNDTDAAFKKLLEKLGGNATKEEKALLDRILNRPDAPGDKVDADKQFTPIAPGTVFADFFLPYRISSACGDNVSFIVSDDSPPEKLSIEIEPKAFCSEKDEEFPVAGKPEGGRLKGEGLQEKDGVVMFNPSRVKLAKGERGKEVLLTYDKDGSRPVRETMMVYIKPTASFDIITNDPNGSEVISDAAEFSGIVRFRSSSVNAGRIEWDFGDGKGTQKGHDISYDFGNEATKRTVTLTAYNGVCQDTATRELSIVAFGVSMDQNEFCVSDTGGYTVTISPAGGNLTTTNTDPTNQPLVLEGSTWKFYPSRITLYQQPYRYVQLQYFVNGTQQRFDVTIFNTVSARIIRTPRSASPNAFLFEASTVNASSVTWNFGDGSPESNAMAVEHTFPGPGTYRVFLNARNGPCDATAGNSVVIDGQRVKSCLPLAPIIEAYEKLPELYAKTTYKSFSASFEPLSAINEFFQGLKAVQSNEAAYLALLKEKKSLKDIQSWMNALRILIGDSQTKGRDLPVDIYTLLTRVVFFTACIQTKDANNKDFPVGPILADMATGISSWDKSISSFTKTELTRLNRLLQIMLVESENVSLNGEEKTKPEYVKLLTAAGTALATLLKK